MPLFYRDISGNLEYIRQHHATKKFNLAALVMSSLAPKKVDLAAQKLVRSSSEMVQEQPPTDKLIRLSSAIGNHNAAVE
jgi:hypothetical protein